MPRPLCGLGHDTDNQPCTDVMYQLASKIGTLGNGNVSHLLLRAGKNLPRWVSLALLIALAWQMARFTIELVSDAQSPTLPVARQQVVSSGSPSEIDISTIIEARLFGDFDGQIEDAPAIDPGTLSDVPETTLDLMLKGTIWDSDRDRAVAIIEYQDEEKVYSIGDPVVAGSTLYAVEPRRVILQRAGGKLEELPLAEPSQISSGSSLKTRQFSQRSRILQSRPVIQKAVDSGALSEIIRPQPHFANNRLQGYRIYPGRQRRVFAELGLRPGDLATSINGVPLTDPEQSARLLAGLDQSGQVAVTVERNGVPKVITIDLDQLSSALQKSTTPGTRRE